MAMKPSSWSEPPCPVSDENPSQYPHNHVLINSECGHLVEVDDTPGRERIRILHGKLIDDGHTFIEMHPDGSIVTKIRGIGYEIVANNKNVMIKGDCNVTIEGNYNLNVKGNYNLKVEGNYTQQIDKDYSQLVSGVPNLAVDGDLNLIASGNLNLRGQKVYVNSDMIVRGNLGGTQTISAVGNITSTQSVFAKLSLKTAGSLMVGLPFASAPSIPVGVYISTPITTILSPIFSVTGVSSFTGATSIKGPTSIVGLLNVTGIITAGEVRTLRGVGLNTHIHGNGNMGSPTTPPII